MPVIVFIIDNSASMNQTTYFGTSYLDIAKSSIENFLKIRSRDQISGRNDRYMLLTLDETPYNIKVGWKEHMSIFTSELKMLRAVGLTNVGVVLKQAFDLLNLNRLSTGMDTYGQGRCPFYLEPSLIILLTDGGCLTSQNSILDDLTLPLSNNILGNELTNEPFRWDQRVFSIILNMSSVPLQETNTNTFIPYASNSPINSMCEVTGGRSYLISTQRMLMQCLESLVGKIQAGVVINFEKHNEQQLKSDESGNSNEKTFQWEKCRRMILVPKSPTKGYAVGHWPIPEEFWINWTNATTLPPRNAIPLVKFKCEPVEAITMDEIPFDKYELEPSPLTQYILERRQANAAWQVFVPNSYKPNELGYPFGYLKPSSNLMTVNLFVMPYNYPMLFQLLNEFQVLKFKPTKSWSEKFDQYVKTIPPYYYAPLRRVLAKKGLQHLITAITAENSEIFLSHQLQGYLKKIKIQAKAMFDQVCSATATLNNPIHLLNLKITDVLYENKEFNNWLLQNFDSIKVESLKNQCLDINTFQLSAVEKTAKLYQKDPLELPKNKLVDEIQKLNNYIFHFMKTTEDEIHSIPIQDMGNYHDYLRNQTPPLRELETKLERQHMFGNPFKLVNKDQKALFGADEIDDVFEESAENQHNLQKNQSNKRSSSDYSRIPNNKRRTTTKGPLSRKICYLRTNSSENIYGNQSDLSDNEEVSDSEYMSDVEQSNITNNLTFESYQKSQDNDFLSIKTSNLKNDYQKESKNDVDNIYLNQNKINPSENETESCESSSSKNSSILYEEKEYIKAKRFCIKQIRKPGKDHSMLYLFLNDSKLTTNLKKDLLQDLIYESAKLKRYNISNTLKDLCLK